MPRGGRRQGRPGQTYGNRSDLNGAKTMEFVGQQYGERARQVASQRAVPAQAPPAPATGAPGPGGQTSTPAPLGPGPGSLGSLTDPTARPDEPISHGMPFGEGPGPEALQFRPSPDDDAITRLRALYQQSGSPALGRLLEAWEDGH